MISQIGGASLIFYCFFFQFCVCFNTADSSCSWPDTEEHRRRKEFCNHIEGYGSVCSCDEPAPLAFTKEPVSIIFIKLRFLIMQ